MKREDKNMSIVYVDSVGFQSEVLESKEKVLVDFFATWCGPCNALAPVLEEVASENSNIKVCKVDIDKSTDLLKKYKIMSVPTLILVNQGEVVGRTSGFQSKEEILEFCK